MVRTMSKMIQIRDVPDDLHQELKRRAAKKGQNLSDYLKIELRHITDTPALEEWLERVREREPAHFTEPIDDIIRADRESH